MQSLNLLILYHLTLLSTVSCFGLQQQGASLSRANFLIGTALPFLPKTSTNTAAPVEIPLQFLPLGGCLAVKISINDPKTDTRLFAYSAIVDTGSPFVTAPPAALRFLKDESKQYPPTQEQYGETVDNMQWGSMKNIEIGTTDYARPLEPSKLIVGLPGTNVVDDTGGIFLGLIGEDQARPTLLRQLGYQSFVLDYPRRLLTLSKGSIISVDDPDSMPLFDFGPFGENIHHYGVLCPSFVLTWAGSKNNITISTSQLDRPVVAVMDSGLTGCVFSDSLRDELMAKGHNVQQQLSGMQVTLPTQSGQSLTLASHAEYWSLTSFKLPWFNDDATHPHVIALGATFLAKNTKSISSDPISKRVKIELS